MKILETDDYKTSAKSYISSRLSELNDQAFAAALREIIFQSNINWKDVQLILARHMPEVKLEVTEPSNFAPNGRCYYNNPKDWKEKLYRAKLSREGHFDSLGYNVFIELDSAKNFLDETAAKLAPVTYDDVMEQLTPINKHPKLKMYIDQSQLGNATVSIEGVLLGGEPISFYDSSFIRTQKDIDSIESQYEKAAKQIDHMYKIGYKGAK